VGLDVPEGRKGGNYVLHSSTLLLCLRNIPQYLDLNNGVWRVIGVLGLVLTQPKESDNGEL